MNLQVLRTPRLTEKSINQKEVANQVTFMVAPEANKIEIKAAIERLFKVTVLNVRTLNMRGKTKRVGRYSGRRQDSKKAVVTLKAGHKIEYFEGA
ncbi:MAG: 50S ribosomal protein L23 [Candidatus Lambdaproteobacteria bacterium]|nr:50S ribosomal protein L23 [Candidatus Lambdaproteobacteria bacterium]